MTHKFGIKLPHSVKEALEINRQTGMDFWWQVINKEMEQVKIAWIAKDSFTAEHVQKGQVPELQNFQEIRCHCIFDIKMDFTQKCRFVAGGHMTEAPPLIMYSSVVSHESVCLAFLIAALNGVNILSCNLENAYLNAKCHERIWFEAGIECGEDAGKVCVLMHALYRLKSVVHLGKQNW